WVQELQYLEAVQLRHLDVQEQRVGLQLRGRLHRLEPCRGLAHDLDAVLAGQDLSEQPARGSLVVDDQDAGHASAPAGMEIATWKDSAPTSTSTRAPSP